MRATILAAIVAVVALPAAAQQIMLREVVTGIGKPVAIAHANDSRLFIATQDGLIYIYDEEELRPQPFLDIRSLVRCCGEQGLLGVVFHPRFHENGFFYVSYVDRSGNTTLVRYHAGLTANTADASSSSVVITMPHGQHLHFAGNLAFGPDGYLYISTGDGGDEDYVNASKLDSLFGKILRIDVDQPPYAIPPSNPFVATPGARGEIWAYGFRNPWRFSFDRETGDLWIGDVGQMLREEIDLEPAPSSGGLNYGWYGMEGTFCHEDSGICSEADRTTLPLFEYEHTDGRCAVTGGYRYRGSEHPELYGTYFYADFCSGEIMAAEQTDGGMWVTQTVFDGSQLISSFGEDADGELYVVDYRGSIYAVDEVDSRPAFRRPRRRVCSRCAN